MSKQIMIKAFTLSQVNIYNEVRAEWTERQSKGTFYFKEKK